MYFGKMSDQAASDEMSYIRGVHQALAYAYRVAMRSKTLEEAREAIGLMEDEAADSRNNGEFSFAVLDDIERAAYRKLREKGKATDSQ